MRDSEEQHPLGGRPPGSAHHATYLIREVAAMGGELDRALGEHLTVNPTNLRAMSALMGRGPLTVSELADALGLGRPATSMAVDRLERLGHVRRERDERDRRRVTIHATPSSADRARAAITPMVRQIDALLDPLSEEQRRLIGEYLHDVVEAMRNHVALIGPAADRSD